MDPLPSDHCIDPGQGVYGPIWSGNWIGERADRLDRHAIDVDDRAVRGFEVIR